MFAQASSGVIVKPQINVFHGPAKVGKTTIAAAFPKPFFNDMESRSFHVKAHRIVKAQIAEMAKSEKCHELDIIRKMIKGFRDDKHDFETFNNDSAESLEDIIHDWIIKTDKKKITSIEEARGGFTKGYIEAAEIMRDIMYDLQQLRDVRGVTVNIIAHTHQKQITDPATNSTYDRYIMRVHHKMAHVIQDLSDNVFFCTNKYLTYKDDNDKTRAIGEGERVMYTQWRPAFEAGCTLNLPFELPLDYEALKSAMENQAPKTVAAFKEELLEYAKSIPLESDRAAAIKRIGEVSNIEELAVIKKRIKDLVG